MNLSQKSLRTCVVDSCQSQAVLWAWAFPAMLLKICFASSMMLPESISSKHFSAKKSVNFMFWSRKCCLRTLDAVRISRPGSALSVSFMTAYVGVLSHNYSWKRSSTLAWMYNRIYDANMLKILDKQYLYTKCLPFPKQKALIKLCKWFDTYVWARMLKKNALLPQ